MNPCNTGSRLCHSIRLGRRTVHKADVHPVTNKVPAALHGFLVAIACSSLGLDQLVVVMWVDQIPAWPVISNRSCCSLQGRCHLWELQDCADTAAGNVTQGLHATRTGHRHGCR